MTTHIVNKEYAECVNGMDCEEHGFHVRVQGKQYYAINYSETPEPIVNTNDEDEWVEIEEHWHFGILVSRKLNGIETVNTLEDVEYKIPVEIISLEEAKKRYGQYKISE